MLAIGQRIYLLRVQKGMTQAELSARSGIPQANLSNIEKGKQDLLVSTLLQICTALQTDPAEFFGKGLTRGRPIFTRSRVERMAQGVFDPAVQLLPNEGEIISLIRDLIPAGRRRRVSVKKVHAAWYELRKRLSDEEIKILVERLYEKKSD